MTLKPDPVELARQAGNALVGAGQFQDAINAYSVALDDYDLEEHPNRHVLLSNRALCWMRAGEPDSAFRDAVEAAEQNPQYVKAWWRLVEATRAMQQRREMVEYYLDRVLELDPALPDARKLKSQMVGEALEEAASALFSDAPDGEDAQQQEQCNAENAELQLELQKQDDDDNATAAQKKEPFSVRATNLVHSLDGAEWLVAEKSARVPDGFSSFDNWNNTLLLLFVLITASDSKNKEQLAQLLLIAKKDPALVALLQEPVVSTATSTGHKVWSLLHVACFACFDSSAADETRTRDLSVFKLLLELGNFDPSFTCPGGLRSVLSEATMTLAAATNSKAPSTRPTPQDAEALKLCLANARSIDRADAADGCTPLWWACRVGSPAVVRKLLVAGADCNRRNDKGESPLCCAVMHGGPETLRALLTTESSKRKSVDVAGDKTHGDQLSAVHLAVSLPDTAARLEMLRILLKEATTASAADVEAVNAQGQRPLHYAAMLGDLECCRFLAEEAGARVDARCGHGMSVVDYAMRAQNVAPETKRSIAEYLEARLRG